MEYHCASIVEAKVFTTKGVASVSTAVRTPKTVTESVRSLLIKALPPSAQFSDAFTMEGTRTAFISPPAMVAKIILGSLFAISKEFAIGEFRPSTRVSKTGERIMPRIREVNVPRNITSDELTTEEWDVFSVCASAARAECAVECIFIAVV